MDIEKQIDMTDFLNSEVDLSKQKDWYDIAIEKLVYTNKDKEIIADITYILSNNGLFKVLLEKYIRIEELNGKNQYEGFYNFWCFVYETIPLYFHKGMTEVAFKDRRRKLLIEINKLKKRWSRNAFESIDSDTPKLLNRELIECRHSFFNNPKMIEAQYGISKPDDILVYRQKWFKDWNSWDRLMIEYPYLLDLTPKKIRSAFRLDLINCASLIIMNEYSSSVENIKSKRPEELIKIGIFSPTTRTVGNISSTKKENKILFEENFDYSDLWASSSSPNDGKLETINALITFDPNKLKVTNEQLLNNEFINSLITNTIAPDIYEKIKNNPTTIRRLHTNLTLDTNDKKILDCIINRSQSQRVRIYLSEFLKILQLTDGSANYKMIENKLVKLPGYWFAGTLSNGMVISFNFIGSVSIASDETGRFADISLGENLYHSILKGRVYKIYQREINKLNNMTTADLAYVFEMERKNLINLETNIYDCTFSYSIDFFRQYIYLNKKNTLKANMDIIQESLSELCENKLIIKSFERHIDYFNIKYYPDTENSKNIINSTFSYLSDQNKT